MVFRRFINNQIKASISEIFTEITEIICKKSEAETRILFLDETMMEADADKFTFIWKKTAAKSLDKSVNRTKRNHRTKERAVTLSMRFESLQIHLFVTAPF